MKICVCIKQVPDVAAPLHLQGDQLVQDASRLVLNAYDASAVEAALVLSEQHGGEVALVLAGPERAKETIRKALAMGADAATHLPVDEGAALDSHATALLLAAYLCEASFDVLLCGKQAQDTDAGLTGAMLAELLGLPYATNAVGLAYEPENERLVVTRQGDAGQEIIALPLPCLVTCSNDMNDPRIPTVKGIMQSKRKAIDAFEGAPVPEARTHVLGYADVPERAPGKKLEDEPQAQARQLRAWLETEARVL